MYPRKINSKAFGEISVMCLNTPLQLPVPKCLMDLLGVLFKTEAQLSFVKGICLGFLVVTIT